MKKVVSVLVLIMLMVGTVNIQSVTVKASDEKECIDGSYLTQDNASEVKVDILTRGAYLKSGSSSIVKAGTGKVTAGGTTVAQSIVSTLGITVRVERLVNGSWQVYTSWSDSRNNAALVTSSKTVSVPSGYYYRTHCFHSANSDASGSYSNGIWI